MSRLDENTVSHAETILRRLRTHNLNWLFGVGWRCEAVARLYANAVCQRIEAVYPRATRQATGCAADSGGNVAIIFLFCFSALMLAVASGVDYAMFTSAVGSAQRAADAAALAGAKQLSLADSNRVNVPFVVEAVVDSYLGANLNGQQTKPYGVDTKIVDASGAPMQVDVKLSINVPTMFGIGTTAGFEKQMVESVATVVGKPNVCLLALDPSAMGTIYLQKNAQVVGQNCAIYSNSTHPNGIRAFNSSLLHATVICSAGGKAGSKGNFEPDPLTDCPQFDDPLAGLPEPAPGACTATNLVIDSISKSLSPGTYCGGITAKGTADVTFSPGIYIIQNGPLLISDTATMTGIDTGFYFTGAKASFVLDTGTTISLTAPKSGPMAGLLFFASRSQSNVVYQILSNNAHQLLGTIYLPTGQLSINANQPIADQSAYTAIVTRTLTANAGPTIVLNTNYDLTDVPVPNGIRGAGMPVELSR